MSFNSWLQAAAREAARKLSARSSRGSRGRAAAPSLAETLEPRVFLSVPAAFQAQQTFASGAKPHSVAVFDVNGDGKADLVIANQNGNSVSVLLGNGNGTFAPQQTFATGAFPYSVAVSDVNGDGKADLVVANSQSNTVSVLLGNGNGTFAPQQTFATGTTPVSVAVSDVNGDGKADLVVANANSGSVSVLLGNGNGTFAPQRTFATGATPVSVAVSDVSGDGKADLVVANFISNSVSVLLGNGNGTFAAPQIFATGSEPQSVAVSDLNGDGRADLVVANFNSSSNSVSVLLGNGNGTFAAQQTFATGSRPYSVAVSDVNGDGKADLVVANQNSNSVSVLLGNGNGSFAAQQTFATGSTPVSVALADVNGDGKADLVVVNSAGSSVSILLGDPQPVVKSISRTTPPGSTDFASSVTYTVTFSEVVTGVDAADFSLALSGISAASPVVVAGSGAVYTVTINGIAGTGTLGLNLVNNGSIQDSLGSPLGLYGTFQAQQTFFAGVGSRWVTTADVNGDGKQDLIVADVNTLGVILGNGNGTFQAEQILPGGPGGINPFFVMAADVNGDGKADLIVANSAGTTPSIGVLLGNGNGTFQLMATFATGSNSNPVSIAVGDVNRDGKPDLVVANFNNNNVGVFLGNGNGTFAAEQTFSTGTGSDPTAVALADVNGDGKLDAIVADGGTGKLGVLPGNGDGTFQTQQTLSTGAVQPNSVQVADVNADGKNDLIYVGNNSVGVFLGNGNGTFLSPQTFSTLSSVGVPALSISVAVADVNGDGKPDLVVVNSYAQANTVGILLGNGNGTFQAQQTYATGIRPQSIALADVNGDGRVDLLVANSTSDTVSELLADSTGNFAGQIYNVTIAANLSLAVSAPGTTAAGTAASYVYTLVVTDLGPSDNTGGFTLTDTLPAGVIFQSGGSTAGAMVSGQTITYTSAGLTNLSAQTYVIAVTAPAMANGTVLQNSATVATLGTPDPVSSNNTVVTSTTSEIPAGYSGRLTFSTTNGNPRSIAVADLNGDGTADLVTADISTSAVSVLLGNGDGTFQPQQTYAAGGNSAFVVVADVNGDGKPDLIVANEFSNTLSVLLANGNGTFQAQVTFATGSTPISVAVSDVNGDGKPDLIVANHGSNNVGVLLGNGNGTFAAQQTFDTGANSIPSSVTVADVNGDGKPDLIVANEFTYSVGVLLGNGNGTFAAKQTVSTGNGSKPFFVAVADVNGDRKGDVIVANYASSTVGVLLGNGNGTFAAQQTFATGATSNPGTIAVSDVNGDGKLDLVVSNTNANTVGVWLGNGNGTFETAQTFSTGAGSVPRAVAVSDVNGDGRGDLLVAFAAGVEVFLGDPPPTVQSINRTTPIGPNDSAASVTYTVTFSKAVTGVDPTDFSLALVGTVTAATPVLVTGGGAVYTVTINGITGSGSLGLNLVNDGSIQDSLGTPLALADTFQSQQTFAAGTGPASVVVADVNNDGKVDLVIANNGGGVSIMLGNGNGTFASQQTLAAGPFPYAVAVSDVNGDGKADLVVASPFRNAIGILLGNGNGTFAAQQSYAAGPGPYAIAVSDVNGDGKADIIAANRTSSTVSVLVGHGDGTFAPPQTFVAGPNPSSIAVADVNDDGQPDLVVGRRSSIANTVSVLLGNGNGTFAAPQTFATGSNPLFVAATDVNGDGKADLIVANKGSNTVSILLGNGNGTFGGQQTFSTGFSPYSVAASDVNGDGKVDLAVANSAAFSASLLLGNGDGTFAAQQSFVTGFVPWSVAVSDVNGDGRPDLVTANQDSSSVSVLLNVPAGSFAGQVFTVNPLVFQPQQTFATAAAPNSVAVADVNSDGKLDLVVANEHGATSVLLGNGNGTFAAQQTVAPVGAESVTVADVNGDGKPDLIILPAPQYYSSFVSVLLGNGNGSFAAPQTLAVGYLPASVAVADVNGDGKPDLIVASNDGSVSVLLGNGNGSFAPRLISVAGTEPSSIVAADVNGDGKVDLVVANINNVSVLLGNGDGTFMALQTFAAGSTPISIAVSDVNDDGRPDIVAANYNGKSVSVLLGNGNGTFAAQYSFMTGSAPLSVAVADVNGDGKADIVVGDSDVSGLSILLGNGNGTFAPQQNFAVGSGSVSAFVAVADVNADGNADIVAANIGNNTVSVLLGDPQPIAQSISRNSPADPVTNATSVTYTVTFSKPVVGVDPSDFTLALSGVTATTPVVVAGSGAVYTVTINGISGIGALGLDLVNDGSIQDSLGRALGPIGTFQTQQTFATGSFPRSVAVADLNGDGQGDLVSVNYHSNSVSVLLGNGNGTFAAQQTFATGANPVSIVVSDVNGDGKADLLVVNEGGNSVSVLLGNGNGTFAAQQTFAAGAQPFSLAVADVNGDGKADLVVANQSRASTSVTVLLGNGNGTFAAQQTFATGTLPTSVAVSDVNGDGKPDLIVANEADGSVSVLLGNGNGTFAAQQTFATGVNPFSVAASDVNRDGIPDLVVANEGSNSASVLLGNGNGTFAAQQTFATGDEPLSVAVSDVNGDGKADLVVANNADDSVSVLLGNGNGSFAAEQTFATGEGPSSVAVSDLNGDGKADLVVANFSNSASVLAADPSGNFTGQSYTIDNPPTITSNGGGDTASVSIPEFTTAVTTVTATDPDAGQTLTYSIIGGDDAAKFQISSGGVLTFITPPDFNNPTDAGADNVYNVTVQASDGIGGTDSQAIAVTVQFVNQAPTFTPGANVTVNEDSGAVTIPGWATGISAGTDEGGQTLTFSVTGITPAVSAMGPVWTGYAGGPQHEAISSIASQPLNAIRWSTPVDLNPQFDGNDLYIHYGTPLITQANTVIVPVKTGASDGFEVEALNGSNGSMIWSQTTDYTLPPHDEWIPSYAPALVGTRMYFAGAGGTVYYRDSVDSATASGSGQIAFYGTANYLANPAAYNSSIHISTPITADAAGNIYFGFQADGSNPLGITDGFARIAPDGTATYTSAATASGGAFSHALTNAAPALSLDGQHLYVAVSTGFGFSAGELLELNSTTLAPQASAVLLDPASGQDAYLPDEGTASPMVGPDGDVYFGVLENPFPANHDRGWMLHFSGDLSQEKTPGAFGWDDTASVVPASMVPSYHGTSSYLIMTKYNNYADPGLGGDGVNKIAILDPNATETDPITGATVMNEVLTIAGVTPDTEFLADDPNAVREWCINTAVVDPATDSILANSEDGKLYRWDLATNTFSQVITLTPGVGEAYTPTLIGADGTVYAINDATLFAVGYSQQDLNSGLFSVPPSVDPATGNLTFTPAPDAFGTSQITLSLMDNGGTANGGVDTTTHTFTITVQPVNDPPTLNAIADPAPVPENSGQQTIALGGITAGPANERTQSLTVTATSNNHALVADPTVIYTSSDLNGTLTYTPVQGAYGSAMITVTVQDSGGTANGGVDTFTRTFNVVVTPAAAISATVSSAPTAVPGQSAQFIIVVSNDGQIGATGVSVSDLVPAGLLNPTYIATDNGLGATGYTASGSGSIGDTVNLPAGAAITYVLNGFASASATGAIIDTAAAATASGVTNTEANAPASTTTNQGSASVMLTPVADVYVSLAGSGPVTVGGNVFYTIIVTNNGPSDVTGATLSDTFNNLAGISYASSALYSRTGAAAASASSASGSLAGTGATLNETLNMSAGSIIEFTITGTLAAGAPAALSNMVTVADPAGTTDPNTADNSSTVSAAVSGVATATVVGRMLFYRNSFFDGDNTGAPTTADFNAIATDKVPLMPGQTATYNNVSAYQDGIDGIFIDISGVPVPANLTAADFEFTVGNTSTPGTGSSPGAGWTALAIAPTVTLFPGMGIGGSDRFALTWPAGTILGDWLQVTVKGNASPNPDTNTGLATPDVFYFGSAPGDSGNTTTDFRVDAADEVDARNDPHTFLNRASIADPNDFGRDSFVNAFDESTARTHSTTFLTALNVISVPGLPNGQGVTSGTGSLSVSSTQPASSGVSSATLPRTAHTFTNIISPIFGLSSATTNTATIGPAGGGDQNDDGADDDWKTLAKGSRHAGAGIYAVGKLKLRPAMKHGIVRQG